jgi:hypothetical protein
MQGGWRHAAGRLVFKGGEHMDESSRDAGLVAVLMQRLSTQRLPRALALKEKVDQGGLLSDLDIGFLQEVFSDTSKLRPLVERHPENQQLVARIIHLYSEITARGLENEKQQ